MRRPRAANGASVELAGVQVHGLERVQERFVLGTLDLAEGSVVDQQRLSDGMTRLYRHGEFERAEFALRGDESRPTLDVYLKEKSWGPHIVRFDVGLEMGTDSNTAFVIGGDYLKTWINPLGGELHGSLYFGRTSTLSLSLYQPLEPRAKYFVEPGITVRRSLEDLFFDDEAVARYTFDRAVGSLDLGRVFGTRAELRAGIVSGVQSADRDIATPHCRKSTAKATAAGPRGACSTRAIAWIWRARACWAEWPIFIPTRRSAAKPSRATRSSMRSSAVPIDSGSSSCSGGWPAARRSTRPCRSTTSSSWADRSVCRA